MHVGVMSNIDENMKFKIVPDLKEVTILLGQRVQHPDLYFDTVISLLKFNHLFSFTLSLVLIIK